ncbi:MAG: DnaA/Hda family protein [Sutterellaceae bacterium]|nr:DnaA/Hda family protein [Sutterellaceae bacterium]MDD7441906.1 DnaA/Hda family protein [Sutterellaceae bacterium]MDY2867432.1 DnaA/Hda family protein [Mesosutterella sp.]
MAQKQLTLDLQIRPAPSLDNFAIGDNAELVSLLRGMELSGKGPRFLYLWGETGVGCTHLLHAMDPLAGAERVPVFSEGRRLYTVDDVGELSDPDSQKLFELMNEVRNHAEESSGGYHLIAAGRQAPSLMKGRPDVISRLSWGLVFQVRPLTDEQKDVALKKLAADSSIELPDDARQWMLEHLPRDMGTLSEALFEVERFALGASRKITRQLLRECFSSGELAGSGAGASKMLQK